MNIVIAIGHYLPAGQELALQTDALAQSLARLHHVRVVTHLTEPDDLGEPGLEGWNVTVPHDRGRVEVETLTPGRFSWRLLRWAGRWQSLWLYDKVYGAELRAQARGADLIYAVEAHGALLSRLARRVAGELGLPFVLRDISQTEPTDADALLMQMVELWELTSDLEGPAPQRPEQQRQPDTAGDGQRVDQSQPDDQR